MEGFPGERFRHGFGLCSIAPEHNNARVVVFHWQAPIVLRLFHLPHVLTRFDPTEGQIAGVRDRVCRELLRVTGVNPHRGLILLPDVLHTFGLNLRDPAEGTPHRHAELVPPHAGTAARWYSPPSAVPLPGVCSCRTTGHCSR